MQTEARVRPSTRAGRCWIDHLGLPRVARQVEHPGPLGRDLVPAGLVPDQGLRSFADHQGVRRPAHAHEQVVHPDAGQHRALEVVDCLGDQHHEALLGFLAPPLEPRKVGDHQRCAEPSPRIGSRAGEPLCQREVPPVVGRLGAGQHEIPPDLAPAVKPPRRKAQRIVTPPDADPLHPVSQCPLDCPDPCHRQAAEQHLPVEGMGPDRPVATPPQWRESYRFGGL